MESRSDNPTAPTNLNATPHFPNVTNLNAKITPDLFNGTNYKHWAYSARMAIGGLRELGYIDASVKEPNKDDPKCLNGSQKICYL